MKRTRELCLGCKYHKFDTNFEWTTGPEVKRFMYKPEGQLRRYFVIMNCASVPEEKPMLRDAFYEQEVPGTCCECGKKKPVKKQQTKMENQTNESERKENDVRQEAVRTA